MANYLDGMDGGKHSSENTEASFTPRKLPPTLSGEYRVYVAPKFIQKIDWKLLREQKLDMLYVIRDLEYEAKEAISAGAEGLTDKYKEWMNSLNGIIHLIDTLQNFAVEEMGLSYKEVFNLEEDE